MSTPLRVGLIVPSSNVTVETEMPQLLARHDARTFSFHSSRMRMHTVSPEALRAMNAQRERCVDELTDAGCDVLLYACLVAIMAQGPGEHRAIEAAIADQLEQRGAVTEVVSSAGALVEALQALDARRIGLVMPYMKPLAQQVVAYVEAEGFTVVDWVGLEEPDNSAVGCISGDRVLAAARSLSLRDTDALVISACVQMPSLPLVEQAEAELGLPVLSAATAGAYAILRRLGLSAELPRAGSLLAGALQVG
jgi:maleate isomerase